MGFSAFDGPVVEEWQRLTQEFQALVTPHDQLGSIYLRQGDVDSAIKEFREVLEIKQETRRAKAYQEKARQILKNIDDVRVRNNPLLKFQSNGKD
jgi:hypothetical protein